MRTLQSAAHKTQNRMLFEIIDVFIEDSSLYFKEELRHVDPRDRRLTMMLVGYLKPHDDIFGCLVSNFQDFEKQIDHPQVLSEFRGKLEGPRTDHTYIQAIGQVRALAVSHEDELRTMTSQRRPYYAIRAKMNSIISNVSDSSKSHNSVGKQVTTVTLFADRPLTTTVSFDSDNTEQFIPLIDTVDLRTPDGTWASNVRLYSHDSPTIYAKVHRNALFLCGSGKKYKNCHRP